MRREGGFTLVEAMIAGSMTVLIVLPAYALLNRTYHFADAVQSRFRQADAARQIFSVLADGTGLFGTTNNARGFPMVEGLHSRAAAPSGTGLRVNNTLLLADTNNLQVATDTAPSVTVQCTAAGMPVPDCQGFESETVAGWLGANPVLASTAGQAYAVGIAVIDPFRAPRAGLQGGSATENFRGIVTLQVEANP